MGATKIDSPMALLFAITIFLASALLFLVEPMIGKMLLPDFGGAPAVWNTCLAFFQAAVLAGYGYALALAHWRIGRQAAVHAAALALPLVVLPFAVRPEWVAQGQSEPMLALAAILCTTVGLPFVVLASTSPLLQQWLAATRHRHAGDPYYLYAASNAGSMLGLLAYPLAVEPHLTLDQQSRIWAAGYAVFAALVAACAVAVWRQHGQPTDKEPSPPKKAAARQATPPDRWMRLRWIALAFIPSSLLLGVTSYLSTDISPVPMIWIVPLALYLLSFMLVFSRLPAWLPRLFAVALPLLVLAQIYHLFTSHGSENYSMWRLTAIHLATFFSAAMVCHGELAGRRPAATFLSQYYLWLSLGGVLGGLFNALVAPLVFDSLAEYPLAMSLACAASPWVMWRWPANRWWLDVVTAVVFGLVSALILFLNWQEKSDAPILFCVMICFLTVGRPLAFGLCAAAIFVAIGVYDDVVDHVVLRKRDFYGVLVVQTNLDKEFYALTHGRIRHGQQRRGNDLAVRDVPLIYYYPSGPIGQVFGANLSLLKERAPVAVVGLGVGSLASYGRGGQEFTFYEIDPQVERIARDDRYFTFLRDSKADCRVVLGDARLALRAAPDRHYGLIVVDAFSGDAIPVHLLTHEAMELYLRKLVPGGLLAFHISNQFLDLAPVLGNLAQASGLVGLDQNDFDISLDETAAGKSTSHWVVLARRERDFGRLIADDRWRRLAAAPELPLWTDDYTSLWGIVRQRQLR